jgi:hypothetical protein
MLQEKGQPVASSCLEIHYASHNAVAKKKSKKIQNKKRFDEWASRALGDVSL